MLAGMMRPHDDLPQSVTNHHPSWEEGLYEAYDRVLHAVRAEQRDGIVIPQGHEVGIDHGTIVEEFKCGSGRAFDAEAVRPRNQDARLKAMTFNTQQYNGMSRRQPSTFAVLFAGGRSIGVGGWQESCAFGINS